MNSLNLNGVISSIDIEKFRGLKNQRIELGNRLTLISGQNATHKTTILGLLAQPFKFDEIKTIYGKIFQAKFGDSFKFSKKFDIPGEHLYHINFLSEQTFGRKKVQVKSYPRPKKDKSFIRLVTGETRKSGEGNLSFPVIYLTLKRVFPLGELKPENIKLDLTQNEIEYFYKTYKTLILKRNDIAVDYIKIGAIKQVLAPHEKNYDGFTISAGQDNLGQIIGSIISFQRVKEHLKDNYKGGIFLIDELDVTLHQAVREEVLKWLYEEACNLNLQIVFTSHSLNLIEYYIKYRKEHNLKKDMQLIYLSNTYDELVIDKNPTIESIKADLRAQVEQVEIKPQKRIKPVVSVFCEDDEGKVFCEYLLGSNLKQYVDIISLKVGFSDLLRFSKCKAAVFSKSLFCLDGDIESKGGNNVIRLPGSSSPEKVFFEFISRLSPAHDLFKKSSKRYTQQVFCKDTNGYENWEREDWKKWFNRNSEKCGGAYRLFSYWAKENKDKVDSFKKAFRRSYNILAQKHRLPKM